MSDTPRVSLLIPTHNNARTIAETIESCLNQTFRDLEIIIYDEESKDATRDIINGYAARERRGVQVAHRADTEGRQRALQTAFALRLHGALLAGEPVFQFLGRRARRHAQLGS